MSHGARNEEDQNSYDQESTKNGRQSGYSRAFHLFQEAPSFLDVMATMMPRRNVPAMLRQEEVSPLFEERSVTPGSIRVPLSLQVELDYSNNSLQHPTLDWSKSVLEQLKLTSDEASASPCMPHSHLVLWLSLLHSSISSSLRQTFCIWLSSSFSLFPSVLLQNSHLGPVWVLQTEQLCSSKVCLTETPFSLCLSVISCLILLIVKELLPLDKIELSPSSLQLPLHPLRPPLLCPLPPSLLEVKLLPKVLRK